MITVPAWGVYREGKLVSVSCGSSEVDAREQAASLNKFNPMALYSAKPIPGKRIEVKTTL